MCAVGAQADSVSHGGTTVNMDFVDMFDVNALNDVSGYGAVGYQYRIGKYEVMASQWAAVIAADSRVGNAGSWAGSQPTASANWYEAAKFCNWLTTGDAYTGAYQFDGGGSFIGIDRSYRNGNDVAYLLPSEHEWYKAAYYTGSGYSLYANGTDIAPGLETDANYGGTGGIYSSPWDAGTGAEEQNATFDMMGNVWEWTEDRAPGGIAFWGGSYRSDLSSLQSGDPVYDDPALQHESIGFRVAVIPEPGTISLMSLSTLSLFFTRTLRRRKRVGKSLFPVGREHLCDAYCTVEEWEAAYNEMDGPDGLSIAEQLIQAKLLDVWAKVFAAYKLVDQKFWNHMVASHEHRMVRKKAFRSALKKKSLNGFDAFLALIMK